MLSTLARAVRPALRHSAVRPLAAAAGGAARVRCLSSAFIASSNATATESIGTQKPVKEVSPGININDVSTGADGTDRTLGESNNSATPDAFTSIRVSDILKRKERFGTALHTVRESDSVREAMQLMSTYNVGAILVTSDKDSNNIVGILSTRDFVRKVTDDGADPRNSRVSEMMSREPVFTYSDASAFNSLTLMTAGGFRHLPVRDRATDRTIGVVSVGDCVRVVMDIFKEKNEYLEDLISGKYPA